MRIALESFDERYIHTRGYYKVFTRAEFLGAVVTYGAPCGIVLAARSGNCTGVGWRTLLRECALLVKCGIQSSWERHNTLCALRVRE